ncbi:fibronectin type III domain-containing protein [Paenibacillus qinlingensis]|uniref:PA14 domain-containing protein n=1 Tax=Paenibacillus qinlingensis TaxID=1837343 RepID=A0ABU1P2M7_9BACL|nr:PA14 domain-containing protein [Paenibacillus qinlingensis]MDR6553472.1 hypothetical protein [Paenibacillus qinlingensis]
MYKHIGKVSKAVCMMLLIQFILSALQVMTLEASADTGQEAISINFQNDTATTPSGFIADYGNVYGSRNGLAYGWNQDQTNNTVVRQTYQGEVVDSFIQASNQDIWEIALENGSYDVSVTVGDAVYSSTNTFYIEGVSVSENVYIQPGAHSAFDKNVTVNDGKLTLTFGSSGDFTALNAIQITRVAMFSPVPNNPQIALPPEARKISGNRVLMSGESQNVHNTPEYIRIPGLQQEISRYMATELQTIDSVINQYEHLAIACNNCDVPAIQAKVNASFNNPVVIKAGQLNLDTSMTIGTLDKPVVLILDGMNTNQPLSVTVIGSLILKNGLNANSKLNLKVSQPSNASLLNMGNLWVKSNLHLNQDSSVEAANQFMAGSLIYNNGTLQVKADHMLIENNLNINTKVDMNIAQEMLVGELISNNQTANIHVQIGDLFIRDNMSVNNHLSIKTGGVFAMGGNLTANQKPIIETGSGGQGQTLLKYKLNGLQAEYFSGSNFTGDKVTRVDENVKLESKPNLPILGFTDQDFSVRWTGQIKPLYTEEYTFEVHWKGSVKLWVDGDLIIDGLQAHNDKQTGSFVAEAGRRYDIRLDYSNNDGNAKATLRWESQSQNPEFVPQAQLYPYGTPVVTAIPTETDITFQWPPIFNASGYEVETDGTIQSIGAIAQYVYPNLEAGTSHTFRVRANNGDITGEWTELLIKWTLPDVPGPIETTSTSTAITLVWPAVIGATGYDIETNNTIIDNGNSTTFVDSSLNSNTQRAYKVRAKNSSGAGKWSPIIAKATLPGATGSLATLATDSTITVSWDAVSGAESYDLEVDGVVVSGITGTRYIHINLQPNSTHTYRLKSKNGVGTSNWSALATAVTLPSIPEHLRATVADTQISIEWDEVVGASNYDIEIDGVIVAHDLSTTYVHNGLAVNSEHTYRVRANNGAAIGQWSGLLKRSTLSGLPTNLRALAAGNEITVTWDMAVGAVGYDVEVDGQIVNNGMSLTYVHSGLSPYSEHTYRVRARNGGGNGPWTDAITVVTTLGEPQNITLDSTVRSITITWDEVIGADDYELIVDGEVVNVGKETSYLHDGLTPYSWHVYRIRAKNADVSGEWSDTFTKATMLGTPVIIRMVATSSQIIVNWGSVVGADGYEIEVDGSLVDNGVKTSFTHSNLSSNSLHTYRVRAKNPSIYSDWSNWSSLVTQSTASDVPRFISAKATTSSITVTWSSASGEDSYDLEVDGKVISGLTNTTYTQDALEPNKMHVYRVRSQNQYGRSEWSEKLEKRTTPEMIVNVGKDNIFNFVIVAPKKDGVTERKITVTYNPEELEVLDSSAITPEVELGVGPIHGTNMIVSEFASGRIVYTILNVDKTVVNGIKLLAKSNEDSKITYTVE